MKKLLLSGFVVITFILYGYQQRHGDGSGSVVPPAAISSSNSSQAPSTSGAASPTTSQAAATYKDGSYTGSVADAYYGNIQVKAVVQNGKLTDVLFLQYPNDRQNSIRINTQAMPYLKQEAIQAQSSQVDIVSGATDTSQAFIQSLGSALTQAK